MPLDMTGEGVFGLPAVEAAASTGAQITPPIMGAALTGYLLADLLRWQRWLSGIGSLFLFAPGVRSGIVGAVVCAPVLVMQLQSWKERRAGSGALPIAD